MVCIPSDPGARLADKEAAQGSTYCILNLVHRLKYLGLFGQKSKSVFLAVFSRKPNSFRGPGGGLCWPIGVTAALLGRLLPSDGHKLVKKKLEI